MSCPASWARYQRCSSSWWKTSAGSSLPAQVPRDGPDDRLEDTRQPLVRDHLLVACLLVERCAVRVEVVEQAAGLVLLDVEPGEAQQAALVVPGVDDLRLDAHAWCPSSSVLIASSSMSKPRSLSRSTRSVMRQRSD